jgi:orotate phosphoribosyltransferase
MLRDRLLALLLDRSLEMGDFILSSGGRSNYYVDCRRTTMMAEGQSLVGRLGWELLNRAELIPDTIGGLTMGADPVSYAIAHTSYLDGRVVNAFSVRKRAKEHGRGKRIEGCFEEGQRVVVVEDAISTGASALEACAAVTAEGGEVIAVLAVVDRESGGREAIEAAGYRVYSIFQISELLRAQEIRASSGQVPSLDMPDQLTLLDFA